LSSIFSGIGIASGLDISSLIQQLLAAEAQRRVPLQARISQIDQTRAALQQTRSLLLALRTSATSLALPSTLSAISVTSSFPSALLATATAAGGAVPGTTSLLIRSLASASRFASASLSAPGASLGASALTLRFGSGRLEDDRSLSLLNGGAGVARGRIRITDRSGQQATIDLRAALSINDVVRAINEHTGVDVEARLRADGRGIEIADTSLGSGTLKVQEWSGGATAASLGILGSDSDGDGIITGATIATLGNATPLSSLRGGVPISDGTADFVIVVDGQEIAVDLGAGASGAPPRAVTLGDALARIESALSAAGVADQVSVSIAPNGDRLRITSTSTGTVAFALPSGTASGNGGALAALGLPTTPIPGSSEPSVGTSVDGARLVFGMNDVGLDRLDGGAGLALSGSLTIVDRAGRSVTVNDLDQVDSIQSLIARIKDAAALVPGMQLSVGVDASGSRLRVADLAPGSGSISVSGAGAEQLGLATLASPNGAANTLQSRDLRRADIGWGTPLGHFAPGIADGSVRITNSAGTSSIIKVTAGMTVSDLARAVNAAGLSVSLGLNSLGDALEVVDHSGGAGTLTVTDENGSAASALRIAGASAEGRIDGTRTISLSLTGNESAEQLAALLNGLTGVDAKLTNDGVDGTFLMVTASQTGLRNGVVLAIDGVELGFTKVTDARDARVLLDPTVGNGVLVTSETNTLNALIPGVSLELKSLSDEIVAVTVAPSLSPLKKAVSGFAAALTAAVAQLRAATAIDVDAGTRGSLYGNSVAARARDAIRSLVGRTFGPDGNRLSSLGITLGPDGAINYDETKLDAALEADPDAVRATLAAEGGVASRVEQLLSSLVEPSVGAIDNDDARLARIADNAYSRIDRIDLGIERRRTVLLARFAAMEAAIERLKWQQSTMQTILSGLGGSQ